MEHGCGIGFCLWMLAGAGRAEVAWVVSQAMQATYFLLLPSPCPHTKPQGTLEEAP